VTIAARPRAALAVLALGLAAIAYVVAAWAVAPGFYDGIAPPAPYRWVSPPPQFRSTNQQPLSGRAVVRVNGGRVDPGSVFSQDGQAAISFAAGAFVAPAGGSGVTIQIAPQTTFPDPGGTQLATNVYCLTSTSPLASGKDALITLQYSSGVPAPSDLYGYQGDGPWQKIGNSGTAAPFYVAARVTALGCFAGGYPRNAAQTAQGARLGGQSLPIIVALAILVVVLAGVPLAVLRRRDGADEDGEG
jgi:hypothetical protein